MPREHRPLFHRSAGLEAGRLTIALQALEVRADLAGVLIAKLPILFQALADDALQFLRQPGIQSSHRRGRAIQDAVEDQPHAVAVKRWRARGHFVQHDAEREQVGAGVKVLRSHLLGRHVRDRSKRAPRTRQAVDRRHGRRGVITAASCSDLGQPEIENLRVSARGDEEICRLDVAVDDAGRVRCFERVGDLDRQRQQPIDLERAPCDLMLQRRPVEKLHDEKRAAVLLADIVDRADVGVVQRRCGSRLAAESCQRVGIPRQVWRQELQRDKPMQPRVLGFVDDAHAAATQLLDDAIVGERLPDGPAVAGRQLIGLVAGCSPGGDLNRRPRQEPASLPR